MASGRNSQVKMSDQAFDFVCTACAEDNMTVEAVKYCIECVGYCCRPCVDAHKKFPALKNHNLMEVDQVSQGSGQQSKLLEIPTERCSIHVAKVLDMYCEGCNAVGCSTCFVKDHKSCPDSHIHSIPDMIDTIFKLADCKQTQKLLKDMMVSMETVSKSKDNLLQMLNKAKKEAMDEVTNFQKALEAIVKKAADSSKREVEATYTELKTEILEDKQTTEDIREYLKMTDDKLDRSEGNRAQKFVCSKLAEEKIKEADQEKIKQESNDYADPQIKFTPDQPLREYVKSLQSLGQVQTHAIPEQKHDLYKIKGSKDINIKLFDDPKKCSSYGCCLTHADRLLVTDTKNKKLKRINVQNMSIVDYCSIDAVPNGVCCISKDEAAVACENSNKIQFVSIQGKMSLTRQIEMSHSCYGIAFNNNKLYVTNWSKSLYVYDMTGTMLKTISKGNSDENVFQYSKHVTLNDNASKIFVGGATKGLVCFDGMGNYLSTVRDNEIEYVDGLCVDGRGNVFVAAFYTKNVVQFSEDGKKVGVVVRETDGLRDTRAVCFHQRLKRLFVTMQTSDVVKMYDLE